MFCLYSAYIFNRVTEHFGCQIDEILEIVLRSHRSVLEFFVTNRVGTLGFYAKYVSGCDQDAGAAQANGRSFHSRGPASEKLLSPSLLCVRGTSSFRMSLELDRSGRRPTSDRR